MMKLLTNLSSYNFILIDIHLNGLYCFYNKLFAICRYELIYIIEIIILYVKNCDFMDKVVVLSKSQESIAYEITDGDKWAGFLDRYTRWYSVGTTCYKLPQPVFIYPSTSYVLYPFLLFG